MSKKIIKPVYTFNSVTADHFELLGEFSSDYDSAEIDGRSVICVYNGANCIGIQYVRAGIASTCPEFVGDAGAYSEKDTFWPYGD